MKNPFVKLLFLILIALVSVSCASSKWEAKVERQNDLVWPPPPNPAKATYLGEISAFTQVGKSLATILFGKSNSGEIKHPVAVAVGADGRIAIADLQLHSVHFYIPGKQKYKLLNTGADQPLVSPVSVTFDDDMRLYVSDSVLQKVFIFNEQGKFEGELIQPEDNQFERPTGLVFHAQSNTLYVVDTQAHKIHKYNKNGQYVGSFGGRGIGNGEFNLPTHIATDYRGQIFVVDAMNFRLQTFKSSDTFVSQIGHHGNGSGDFAMPKGVAVDRWGVVYIAEILFDRLQLFDSAGRYLMSIGEKGSKEGQFWMPSGIFIDRQNILYVCDTYNKRIQLFQLGDIVMGGK